MTATGASAARPDEARVRVDSLRAKLAVIVIVAVVLCFAAAFGWAVVAGHDAATGRILAGVFGAMLMLLAAGLAIMGRPRFRRRTLVVTADAVSLDAVQPWRIRWNEAREISLEVGFWRTAGLYRLPRDRIWQVALHVTPRDPDTFADAHPELGASRRTLEAARTYGITIADDRSKIDALDAALTTFTPTVGRLPTYYGVVDRGHLFLE